MRRKLLCKTFATMQEYQACREEVNQCLRKALGSEDEKSLTMLEIAMNEAINNAFKYGSRNNSKCTVTLGIFWLDPNCLLIRIKDTGCGFNIRQVKSSLITQKGEEDEQWLWGESGRGLFIMERVMDQVHYNAKGNTVSLLKYFTKPVKDIV